MTPEVVGPGQLGLRLVVAVEDDAGRRARPRPGPRAARRRWPRRRACPPRGPGGPWPGRGTPSTRRPRRRRRRPPPPGSGPAGGPRRRRTAACRARRPGRRRSTPPTDSRPPAPTAAVSGRRYRGSGAGHRATGHIDSGALTPEQVEADGQADAGRLHQPQPGLGQLGADPLAHHVAVVVEAVEAAGQLAGPGGDLVRAPGCGRRRPPRRAARPAPAARRARGDGRAGRGRPRRAGAARCPAAAAVAMIDADAGVGVLHVDRRGCRSTCMTTAARSNGLAVVDRLEQEREPGHVGADLVEHLGQLDELPAALAHADHLARPQERHQLAEDDLQPVGVVAQGLHADLEPGHVAVVVGAPDVDEAVEAPLELVAVVGDVAQQVGRLAAGLDQDLVLGAGRSRWPAATPRRRPRRRGRGPAGRRGWPRWRPTSTIDRSLNQVSKRTFIRASARRRSSSTRSLAPLARVGVVGHLRRPVGDVLALVAVLRHRLGPPCRAARESANSSHLPAPVVDVVLPVDLVAAPLEDAAQGVAVGRPPAAAGVERAGGVGADELDVDPLAAAQVVAGVARRRPPSTTWRSTSCSQASVEAEVHEPGPGHRRPRPRSGGGSAVEPVGDGGGQLAGRRPGGLGQGQGHVRRPVAVLGPGRALDGDGRRAARSRPPPGRRAGTRPGCPGSSAGQRYGRGLRHRPR